MRHYVKWVWRLGPILIVALILPGLANRFTRVDLDNLQPQWSTAAGYPNQPSRLVQSFVAHQPGLESIELTAAVYGTNGDSRRAQTGQIVFRLQKALDTFDLATWVLPASELVHNDPVYFRFNPQWDSKDQRFFLVIELPSAALSSEPIISFWSTLTDVYPEGDLSIDQQVVGDLTFKTYYRYSFETIGTDVAWLFPRLGFIFLICLFLWSPGYLLSKIFSLNLANYDVLERVSVYVCLTLVLPPLLFLWTSALGIKLEQSVLQFILWLVIGVALFLAIRSPSYLFRDNERRKELLTYIAASINQNQLAIVVLSVGLVARLLMVRDLIVPSWVDAVHHTAIATLMAEQGHIPITFDPFVAMPYNYHFGFHSLIVLASWLTNQAIEQTILLTGQIVSLLIPLVGYTLTTSLQMNKRLALGVMVLLTFFTTMPTYYMNWSRYTILTGLVLLLATCAMILRCLRADNRMRIVTSLLLAGLLITHYRLIAFASIFIFVVVLEQLISHRSFETLRKLFSQLTGIGALALVLVAPWFSKIMEFVRMLVANRLSPSLPPSVASAAASYSWMGDWLSSFFLIVPRNYDRLLFALMIVGILFALVFRQRHLLIILAWYSLLFLLAALQFLSLSFEDNPSDLVAITVFYGLALFSSFAVETLARRAKVETWLAGVVHQFPALKAIALLLILWIGAANVIGLIDANTILYTRYDDEAMAWIKKNIPSTSGFLNNAYHWRGDVFYGADGGYWIQLKTNRPVTLPPLIYGFAPLNLKNQINALANLTFMPQDWNDEKLIQGLLEQNVGYIYLGHHGGQMKVEAFEASPYYQLVYSNSRVSIFKIKNPLSKPF